MRYIFYILTTLFSTLLAYFVSFNVIITILVGTILISYFIFLEYVLRKKIIPKLIKKSDLNIFIHDFLLSYLDNREIKFSLKKANLNISNNLKEEMRLLDEYSGVAILTNLESYFSSSLYNLFLLSLNNKEANGLENIKFILKENENNIKKREEIKEQNKKALWQFSLLWLISFIILTILRISLNNYFATLKNSFFYIVGISLYFLVFFLSLNLFVFVYFRREVNNG